ncbi:MAG TPA: cytochrome c3 family protein [Gemmataceae bacterium]|nr:cytochrome c3 family protein [Gemmataceae bacterium]
MAQIFLPRSNTIAKLSLLSGPLLGAFAVWVCLVYARSSYGTGSGEVRVQPVPFSHQHHVGDLGIDCRYCHTTVENSSYAGMPPTKTCMNCHSQMWVGSDMLEPVRASYQEGKSLHWKRVYNLPGFVYFNHSIHIHKGVGCTTCHGRIDEMPLMYQKPSVLMEWCLDCHRNPGPNLRPQSEIFNVKWQRPSDQDERGAELAKQYQIRDTRFLTSCTVCHR